MFSLAMPIFTLCVRFILFIVSGWCIAEYWQWSCGGFENRCLMICFFSFRQVGGGGVGGVFEPTFYTLERIGQCN